LDERLFSEPFQRAIKLKVYLTIPYYEWPISGNTPSRMPTYKENGCQSISTCQGRDTIAAQEENIIMYSIRYVLGR
jgi:hypothetical protein